MTYRTGTIALTAGSTAVVGTGTAWTAALRPGQMLQVTTPGLDPTLYEIAAVVSATSLTLERPWGGTTGAGRAYQVAAHPAVAERLADALEALLAEQQAATGDRLAGIFPGGTLAAPGLRFAGDLDTGVRQAGPGLGGLVANGVDALRWDALGPLLIGDVRGTGVQANSVDRTFGRMMKFGFNGIGGNLPTFVGNIRQIDNSIVPGIWYGYVASSGSVGGPPASTGQFMVLRRQDDREAMIFLAEVGGWPAGPGTFWGCSRHDDVDGGAWSAWTCGSVQQSAGTANGRFVRDTFGNQVCWHDMLSLTTGEATWTYPAQFASATDLSVQLTPGYGAVELRSARYASRGATSTLFSVVNQANARVACEVCLTAFGRWY